MSQRAEKMTGKPAISLKDSNFICWRATCRGGNGISDEYHVMRVLLNLETVNTDEGRTISMC